MIEVLIDIDASLYLWECCILSLCRLPVGILVETGVTGLLTVLA